jgi:mevalonate kinase
VVKALKREDLVEIGALMNRNHSLLFILGASSKELQNLVDAAEPLSYGAKLTGAGGGGSIIALTDDPERVADAIKNRGGRPYVVNKTQLGTEVRELSPE